MRFCITGTGRCGTRLLRDQFNAHPNLYVHNETHWIPKMFEFFGTQTADVDTLLGIINRTYHVTGVPVTSLDGAGLSTALAGRARMTVAEFCDAVGGSLARQHGKDLWADKTPDYGPYLQTLQLLWPKCRMVHVIRDGLEVALSMSRHPGFRWMTSAQDVWWGPAAFNRYYEVVETRRRPFVDFVELWYLRLSRIRDEATRLRPGSYLEVRFEDLIERPQRVLQEIAGFVDVPVTSTWLNEAADLVDVDRIHCRAREIRGEDLRSHHRELLSSLGYRRSSTDG